MRSRRSLALLGVITAAFVAVTVSLGIWQLGRGQARLAEARTREAGRAESPMWYGEVVNSTFGRRVRVRGAWLASATIFLDNRVHNDQAGYYVVTPLKLENDAILPVFRGWMPKQFGVAPQLETDQNPVKIVVRLESTDLNYVELSKDTVEGAVWQNFNWARFQEKMGRPLIKALAYQESSGDGLVHDWPLRGVSAEQNFIYAGQWFLFAAMALIFYVVHLVRRKRSHD